MILMRMTTMMKEDLVPVTVCCLIWMVRAIHIHQCLMIEKEWTALRIMIKRLIMKASSRTIMEATVTMEVTAIMEATAIMETTAIMGATVIMEAPAIMEATVMTMEVMMISKNCAVYDFKYCTTNVCT